MKTNHHGFFYTDKERYAFYGFAIGAVVFSPFLYISIMADSMTMIATSIRSAAETLSLLITWMGLRKVARKELFIYNYGAGKIENLSSLAIAAAMVLAFADLSYRSIDRIYRPAALNEPYALIGILAVIPFFLLAIWLLIKSYHVNRRDPSPAGDSQWRLYLAKTVIHTGVVFSLGASLFFREHLWSLYIDPAVSFLIGIYILGSAYLIGRKSIDELLDRTIDEPLQMHILRELAAYFDEYLELHGVRSRRSGQFVYIEIFLEFDGSRTMNDVQLAIKRMTASLEEKIPGSQVLIIPRTAPIDS